MTAWGWTGIGEKSGLVLVILDKRQGPPVIVPARMYGTFLCVQPLFLSRAFLHPSFVLMRDAQVTHSTRFVMPQAPDGERAEDIWAGATSLSRTFQRLPGKVRGGVLQYLALHLQPGIFMP